MAARIDGLLHREVIAASATGTTDRALELAELARRRQMLDEGAQILLVASLRAAGRYDAAAAVVDEVEARFRAELILEDDEMRRPPQGPAGCRVEWLVRGR